jgi:tRNA A37 threonylcarbamoyladenosine modification protein TsaB
MDAHRAELFAAEFQVTGGQVALIEPTRIVGRDRWLRECCAGDTATGPGLGLILQELPHAVRPVGHELWAPRAATVGTLAWLAHQRGQHDDPWSLTPNYFRQSAAEEKSRTPGTNGR